MNYSYGNPQDMRRDFWKALAHSPYLMLQRDDDPASAAPMTPIVSAVARG